MGKLESGYYQFTPYDTCEDGKHKFIWMHDGRSKVYQCHICGFQQPYFELSLLERMKL